MKPNLLFVIFFLSGVTCRAGQVATCAADLDRQTFCTTAVTQSFCFVAQVVGLDFSPKGVLVLRDETGSATTEDWIGSWIGKVANGDSIRVSGVTRFNNIHRINCSEITNIVVLSHGTAPAPERTGASDVNAGRKRSNIVRVEGVVFDARDDELDPEVVFLILDCNGEIVYVAVHRRDDERSSVSDLIGARVSVSGINTEYRNSVKRAQIRYGISTCGLASVRVLEPAPQDRFDVQAVSRQSIMNVPLVAKAGRRKIAGRVTAVWGEGSLLLESALGEISLVQLSDRCLPQVGESIEAVGVLETDTYHLNLSRAIWRPHADIARPTLPILDITPRALLTDGQGHRKVKADVHGRTVRLKGTIRNLPADDPSRRRFLLDCDGYPAPVDFSAAPDALADITPGCTLEATGVCVLDIGTWRPQAPFPHINGFMVVLRSASDLTVVSRPSWWTPRRLTTALASLLALLLGILVWNRILRRLVEKRSRELSEETVARVTSDLKVYERTRLAVELHDSVAQNMTAIALEVNTAARSLDTDLGKARTHLTVASQSLKSCRNELRYCLWDLRNSTLEETDMNEAIHRTLKPQLGEVELTVRFSVPRERISDNTAHAILRIVRELSVNAVRHGGATAVRVAGSIEGDKLMFSVRDNGCGFDPESCPGVDQGHFGLLGIRERVESFEGTLRIDSAPGRGTKAVVSLNIPNPPKGEAND